MRVLVIGHGGREHALAWKLSRSPSVSKVFVAQGNWGTAEVATNVAIPETDHRELIRFCQKERIDLVVIGPEAPLVAGLADDFRQAGIPALGPSKEAARLEGSKVFCKRLLQKAKVPTPPFQVFNDMEAVEIFLSEHLGPCVVKADGLAAGKGAIVCDNSDQAREAAARMLIAREFGPAGDQILIEERLTGQELSVLALTDGRTISVLEPCQDHKRLKDDDQGPNTGGMGAYCPASLLSPDDLRRVETDILIPTLHALRTRKSPFQGVLYAGLMLTRGGLKVLEYNVRFGDPECQPLLMRWKSDLGETLLAAATGRLADAPIEWDPRPAVCVVMASAGYPESSTKGSVIRGLDRAPSDDVMVFHAATHREDDRWVTSGGRVLGVTALGATLTDARDRAYEVVDSISFTGAQVRRDIAARA